MTAALVAAFVALSGVVLWSVIGGRGHWALKLPLVVAVPVLSLGVHRALEQRAGWPTTATPPRTAQFLAGFAREPAGRDKGALFLYLLPPGADKPRSYVLPYSRPNHEALEKARQQAKAGGRVGLRFTRDRRIPRWAFRPYRLPVPQPPSKHH